MFSDLLNHGGPEKFSLQSTQKDVEEKVEFKSVAFQKFMLRNVCDGIYEYIPITFDESHFCVSLCTVHSVLMDFRFRSKKVQAQFITKDNIKEKIDQKKQKEEEKRSGKQIGSAENASDYSGPTNLTEYLFADKYGELSETINATEINQIYLAYMQSLIDSYDRLKSKFNQFQTRCLSDKQKRECGLLLVAPQLMMPQEKDRQDEEMDQLYSNNDNSDMYQG